MFKTVLMLGLFTSLAALGANEAVSYSQEIDHSVQRLSKPEITQLMQQKVNNCYAYTPCFGGRVASCQTYGPNCSFYIQPGQFVQCSGYNAWGQWVNISASCW